MSHMIIFLVFQPSLLGTRTRVGGGRSLSNFFSSGWPDSPHFVIDNIIFLYNLSRYIWCMVYAYKSNSGSSIYTVQTARLVVYD